METETPTPTETLTPTPTETATETPTPTVTPTEPASDWPYDKFAKGSETGRARHARLRHLGYI